MRTFSEIEESTYTVETGGITWERLEVISREMGSLLWDLRWLVGPERVAEYDDAVRHALSQMLGQDDTGSIRAALGDGDLGID